MNINTLLSNITIEQFCSILGVCAGATIGLGTGIAVLLYLVLPLLKDLLVTFTELIICLMRYAINKIDYKKGSAK